MVLAMAWPCAGPRSNVRRISRSRVPCSSSMRSFCSLVDILGENKSLPVECQCESPHDKSRIVEAGEEPYSTLWALISITGCRAGEILGLKTTEILKSISFAFGARLTTPRERCRHQSLNQVLPTFRCRKSWKNVCGRSLQIIGERTKQTCSSATARASRCSVTKWLTSYKTRCSALESRRPHYMPSVTWLQVSYWKTARHHPWCSVKCVTA